MLNFLKPVGVYCELQYMHRSYCSEGEASFGKFKNSTYTSMLLKVHYGEQSKIFLSSASEKKRLCERLLSGLNIQNMDMVNITFSNTSQNPETPC